MIIDLCKDCMSILWDKYWRNEARIHRSGPTGFEGGKHVGMSFKCNGEDCKAERTFYFAEIEPTAPSGERMQVNDLP
jgi:hypothetical protein